MVIAAKVAELPVPNRTSRPSIDPPTAWGTVPGAASSITLRSATDASAMVAMAATIASPWRRSPTIRPNTLGRAKGIRPRRKISSQLVQAVGFSNGCAELAL